jgi:imidazolonepropionase-like amidohydrolase
MTKSTLRLWSSLLCLLVFVPAIVGQTRPQTYAIRNAKIVTVTGPTIPNGTILIQDGKIVGVGANLPIPSNAKVIDARGLTAYPGMIDPHTAIGLQEIGSVQSTQDVSELGEINPYLKASAAINPLSEHVAITRANGITTVGSLPRGGLISGQGAVINLDGWVLKDVLVKDSAAMVINYPRDVNLPANATERQRREAEDARKKRIDLLHQTLKDAQAFAKIVDVRAADADTNPALRAMVPVINGQEPALFNVETANEIKGALDLIDEFKLKAILSGCAEAWKVVNLLKSRNVPVILGAVLESPGDDSYPYDANYATAAALVKAGVKIAFTSDSTSSARDLPWHAGISVAFGLPKDEAVKAVTINAAQILGIDAQTGSISEGKIANIMLTDGDPLEHATKVKQLFIAGKPVELKSKHTDLYEKFIKRP